MKTLTTPAQVREGMNHKELTPFNGRVAVISVTKISKRKQCMGVQFWTAEQIEQGSIKNTDGTTSKFVELY